MATLSKQTAARWNPYLEAKWGYISTSTYKGMSEPAELQFWLKTALNDLHNKAGHLTSQSNTPAFSDLPGKTGEGICLIFFTT